MVLVKPIDPKGDPRVEHKYTTLNGQKYHYIYAKPSDGNIKATIVLVHGWPDLAAGWRYQIPVLAEMGLQVAALEMMGYGETDAPEPLEMYSFKRASDDIAELAKELGASKIILGGHDWGGMVVWRCAGFYPDLITNVFAVCTPYVPASPTYMSTEDLVNGPIPQFGYQLHLASGEVEKQLSTKEDMNAFLRGMYGARTPDGGVIFSPFKGVIFENVHKTGKSPLLSDNELEYYSTMYARNGLRGVLNWYRTRKVNWETEQSIVSKPTIDVPCLFIGATKDLVLKPEMAEGMNKLIPKLTMRQVEAGHWALWERPDDVNAILGEWFKNVVFGESSKL